MNHFYWLLNKYVVTDLGFAGSYVLWAALKVVCLLYNGSDLNTDIEVTHEKVISFISEWVRTSPQTSTPLFFLLKEIFLLLWELTEVVMSFQRAAHGHMKGAEIFTEQKWKGTKWIQDAAKIFARFYFLFPHWHVQLIDVVYNYQGGKYAVF